MLALRPTGGENGGMAYSTEERPSWERDRLIMELRRRGYSMRQIAKVVGVSKGCVQHTLERVVERR